MQQNLSISNIFTTFAPKITNLMNSYTHRYSITAADMDTKYRMTPSAVLLYYQDAWARYMACLHLAAFDLVHQNLMWVISEFNARFEEQDAFWSQDVDVTIWNSELSALRLYVDFRITAMDGTLLSSGYGCWTLLDTQEHKLVANSILANQLPILDDFAIGTHKKIRLPEGTNVLQEVIHRVNPINLDFNGHVNNRTYLSIAMQTVSERWQNVQSMRSMSIRWLKETFLGDTLQCRLWNTNTENAYLQVISKEDAIVAQVFSEWASRTRHVLVDDVAPRT